MKYNWRLLLLLLSLLLLSNVNAKAGKNILFDYDHVKPFLWGESTHRTPGYYDLSILDDTLGLHPLGLGKYAFYTLWKGSRDNNSELLELGRKYIEFLARDYPLLKKSDETTLYIYPRDNKELKGGHWHSGMANSIIALSFLQAYFLFEETSYLRHAEQTMKGVSEYCDKGGSALPINDGKWFLEYAAKDLDRNNARFVLNGFLYQLLALKLYGECTGNEYFLAQYEYGLTAYRELYDQFHYLSNDWTFYDLNPKSVEPPHYVIFDIVLLDALYKLTDEDLFTSESDYRRKVLKSHYNLESIPFSKEQDIYLFSQVGPPNPYWVDIYPSIIRYISEDETRVVHLQNPRDFTYPITERCFSMDTLSADEFNSVEVWAKYLSDSVLLYGSELNEIQYASKANILPNYELTTGYKAEKISPTTAILSNPASETGLNRGLISAQFDQIFDGYADKYLGIVFNSERDFRSIRIFLTNTLQEKASRYYINTLEPKKDNLILISVQGLKDVDRLANRDFSSVQLHLYNTPPDIDSPYSVEIKEIIYFSSNYNLKHYLQRNTNLIFKEKE